MNDVINQVSGGKAVLLDVRTDQEWQEGHAKSATHFDITRLVEGELPPIDKSMPVYTYCKAGGRAGRAKDILNSEGYTAQNLGGLSDWEKLGGEVVNEPKSN
jgi:rhodanese-related sulfurtransferase